MLNCVTQPKQARLSADWYGWGGGGGGADSAPSTFCFNGPIDLKFGM